LPPHPTVQAVTAVVAPAPLQAEQARVNPGDPVDTADTVACAPRSDASRANLIQLCGADCSSMLIVEEARYDPRRLGSAACKRATVIVNGTELLILGLARPVHGQPVHGINSDQASAPVLKRIQHDKVFTRVLNRAQRAAHGQRAVTGAHAARENRDPNGRCGARPPPGGVVRAEGAKDHPAVPAPIRHHRRGVPGHADASAEGRQLLQRQVGGRPPVPVGTACSSTAAGCGRDQGICPTRRPNLAGGDDSATLGLPVCQGSTGGGPETSLVELVFAQPAVAARVCAQVAAGKQRLQV